MTGLTRLTGLVGWDGTHGTVSRGVAEDAERDVEILTFFLARWEKPDGRRERAGRGIGNELPLFAAFFGF